MFPLMRKHLYLGQSVDGYAVVNFNSNYTGGIMRTPYINDPLVSNGQTYTQTVSDLATFNSGGSVTAQGGISITTPFTDWRIPSKVEMDSILNIADNAPGIVTSNRPAWTSTQGEVGGIPTPSTKWVLEYSSTGTPYFFSAYDYASSYFGAFFIRNFTL